jgi:NAD+ kinase
MNHKDGAEMSQEKRVINVFANENAISRETRRILKHKLEKSGFVVPRDYDADAELIICVGGDGSFLHTLHKYDFPNIPFIGINTGHLGFFQELYPDQMDEFIFKYKKGSYAIQEFKTIGANISTVNEKTYVRGLNEIVIRGDKSITAHLNISIEDSFVERFSGDGILVATPAGSTAYNYALGGSIVDPRLSLLQITPIAPMNTTAYRSFMSSVIVPPDLTVNIYPEYTSDNSILIIVDGLEYRFQEITDISINFSETTVKLLRFENYDFWNKVKSKFL